VTLEFSITWVNSLLEPVGVWFSVTCNQKNLDNTVLFCFVLFFKKKRTLWSLCARAPQVWREAYTPHFSLMCSDSHSCRETTLVNLSGRARGTLLLPVSREMLRRGTQLCPLAEVLGLMPTWRHCQQMAQQPAQVLHLPSPHKGMPVGWHY
jgi:hypothetical protein